MLQTRKKKRNARSNPRRSRQDVNPNSVTRVPNNTYRTTMQQALGFSRSQIVKMRYCQQVTLSPAATNTAYIVYAANGPFSPNISSSASTSFSASHQPKSWDQWTAIYNEYIVISADCFVTISPPNSTNPTTAGGLISILLSDSSTPYSTGTSMIEDGKASWKQFNPNTSSPVVSLRKNFTAKKFWRLNDIDDNQKGFGAFVTANPTELAYFQVSFFANDPSITTSAGPLAWVVIDYVVLFTGPQDLTPS